MRLAIITASMTTVPQKLLANTHTSTVEIPIPVFPSGTCAEATPCARTDLMLQLVMRLSLVSQEEVEEEKIQKGNR